MTPAAAEALEAADVVVGYRPSLRMVENHIGHARVIGSGMRAEVERAEAAVAAARGGATVAVVSSGDAGVYGMAGLVLEVLGDEGAEAVDVAVVPGMTAALAAAAVLGAPLTNDFACISLSDLLTPLEVIESRLSAVAAADLVVALYNPRSNTRTEPLDRALAILRDARGDGTLVGAVRDAGREGERCWVSTLGELDPAEVDMSTILIVGNSATRLIGGRMVTPRGYRV
jgi:precorrin-3B C17-methyltransferase